MASSTGPDIVTDGLVLALDAANPKSYPGSTNIKTLPGEFETGGEFPNPTKWKSIGIIPRLVTLAYLPIIGEDFVGPTPNTSGGYIEFDGINDYVSVGTNSELSDTECTISFWIYFTQNNVVQTFFMSGASGADSTNSLDKVFLYRDASNVIRGGWLDGNEPDYVASNSAIAGNQWANIVLRYSLTTNNVFLYINGVQQLVADVLTGDNKTNHTDEIVLGNSTALNQPFSGNIAAFYMYNKALTALEIEQNFNATRTRFGI